MWANMSEKRALLLSTSKFVENNQPITQSISVYWSRTIISVSYRTCDERVIFWKVVEEYHPQAKPKNRHECIFVTIPQNTSKHPLHPTSSSQKSADPP